MQMDRRFAIIVACSLGWGLLVSLFFYRLVAGGRRAGPGKTLVVAARALGPGTLVAAESVKTIRVPESFFPKGGYEHIEDVVGRPVTSSIQPDEAVVEARLAPRGSGFGVAPLIPAGMRAMAVRVNDVAGVAGFVLPGMRVDILATGKPPGAGDTITATVLQNVQVLSAGQTVQADTAHQSISVPVVTLLVTPAQAESLTLATNEGHIQLVLRNSGDQKLTATSGRKLRDLYAAGEVGAAEPPPAPPREPAPRRAEPRSLMASLVAAEAPATRPAAPPPPVESMILIRGDKKTIETFVPQGGRR